MEKQRGTSSAKTVVDFIDKVLMNIDDEVAVAAVAGDAKAFMKQFPLYPELK